MNNMLGGILTYKLEARLTFRWIVQQPPVMVQICRSEHGCTSRGIKPP